MPGRATSAYVQTGKPKVSCTAVQERAVFEERIQLERHHESNLPSQRYRERNKQPPARNPIVSAPIHESLQPDEGQVDEFDRTMAEVSARSPQPLPTSNPIFGYSVHRAVVMQGVPGEAASPQGSDLGRSERSGSRGSERSSSSKSSPAKLRMAELQQKIRDEREKRIHLERLLASPC